MINQELGIVLREISVRKPSLENARRIIDAQSQKSNRRIESQWHNGGGELLATATINPHSLETPQDRQNMSLALKGASKLTAQEII